MDWSRRSLFGAALAALFAPTLAGAEADPDRAALIDAVRAAAVGFDVLEVARTILTEARLEAWIPEVEALIGDRERSRGLRSMMEWAREPEWGAAVAALQARMGEDLRTKLTFRRLAKRAPTEPEAVSTFIEGAYSRWLGLDLPALRAATAALPDDGLLVAIGPPTTLWEVLFSAAREPFVRYLELVHGRRATVWVASVDDRAALLRALLDPAHQVVAFVGHGEWQGFSLLGYGGDPLRLLTETLRKVKDSPRKYLPEAIAGRVLGANGYAPHVRGDLGEEALAALVQQLGPVAPKQLVVRYTCGNGRYRAEQSRLLWELIPDDLDPKPLQWGDSVSAPRPEAQGAWEVPFSAWLADKRVTLTERPALGTCLVASPADTRGYEGESWLPHFVEDPIPAYHPPYVWPVPAEEAPAEPEGEAAAVTP